MKSSVGRSARVRRVVGRAIRAPSDLFDFKQKRSKIELLVLRVFIMNAFAELIPGVVFGRQGSEVSPLHTSREALRS